MAPLIEPHGMEAGFREIMMTTFRSDLAAWPHAWPIPMEDQPIMSWLLESMGPQGLRWVRCAGWVLFANEDDLFWYRIMFD